jgi:hypothetical protein
LLFSRDVGCLALSVKVGEMWRARVPTLTPFIDATLHLTECMQRVGWIIILELFYL